MFADIDYMGGEVRWSCEAPEEDMLTVVYPNGMSVYVGFTNRFIIEVIKDGEHGVPFAASAVDSREEMYEKVKCAVKLAAEESQSTRSHYGALWKTREL